MQSGRDTLLRALAIQGSVPSDQLRAWASWKREGRSDKEKYEDDFRLEIAGKTLVTSQSRTSIGTTVWDGSIVMAKHMEARLGPQIRGSSCIELGSGSQALPGLAAACLGASRVVVSDTGDDIVELLRKNVQRNKRAAGRCAVETREHFWGADASGLGGPFDWILVAEFCYIDEAMGPLVGSMRALCHEGTRCLMSYGRNRRSEDVFMALAEEAFDVRAVPEGEWHPDFVDKECTMLLLTPKKKKAAARPAGGRRGVDGGGRVSPKSRGAGKGGGVAGRKRGGDGGGVGERRSTRRRGGGQG